MTTTIKAGRWQATPRTSDTCDSPPIALQLKVLLFAIAALDAAALALLPAQECGHHE
jgi:hypothetical protein